ncbi:STAS domain-containing protein [Novosphingobium sp. B 225]|uniref:STAS domain-containing protein n=1 Tax=Novosphingobium sp. B 225 TaxID=1961849 RepID=UPI000B4BCF98|nr:STAS domain-containing protein [Novosphingobium sp. B 225]
MQTITLPERCDRGAAEVLLPEFATACASGPVLVDASAVSHAGLAMLQLLASARRSCEGLRITPSAALREAAGLTGLTRELFDEGEPA